MNSCEHRDGAGGTRRVVRVERVSSPGEDKRKKMELLGGKKDKREEKQVLGSRHGKEGSSSDALLTFPVSPGPN